MKVSKTSRQDMHSNKMLAWLVMPIGSAGSGLVIGAVVGFVVGDMFEDLIGFELVWWQTAILGFLVGAALGTMAAFRTVRDMHQLVQALTSHGMRPLSNESTAQVQNRLRTFVNNPVQLNLCHFNSFECAHLVIGELTIEGTRSKSPDGTETRSPNQVQTCAYFDNKGSRFPSFELRPERMMVRLLARLSGTRDLDFKDSPLFSKKYFLESDSLDNTRKLFNRDVLDTFEKHAGYRVIAGGGQVLLFKPNKTCGKGEYDSFVATALEIFTVLQQSAIDSQIHV